MKFFPAIISYILFITFTFSVPAQDETRAGKTWDVQKYDITATLPPTETDRNLTAKAILTLKNVSGASASRLTLRINSKAEVSAVKVNDTATDFSKGEENIGGNRILQRILIRLPAIQSGATFTVAVDYKLKVEENSGLNALSPIGSQFLPLSFWYPTPNSWYFARGADFASMRLQVNTANGETAISSGKQVNNQFEQKLNVQPFFITGNWDVINSSDVSVFVPKGANAEMRKRADALASLSLEAKKFTANLLGTNFEEPIRIVAVKRGAGFSSGGTIFVEEGAFRREKIDSQTAMTIAEAVAKVWIVNATTLSGAGYGVIREGLPRYIAALFLEKQFGRDAADLERLRERTSYASISQRDAPLTIVSSIDDYYYTAVANKGAMVWRQLAARVGQETFFNELRALMKDGNLDLSEIRSAFPAQKDFLDYSFDQTTDTNLSIGLPQTVGGESKIALRNTGSLNLPVNVIATTVNGEKLTAQTTLSAKSFGEVVFKNPNKIIRVEVDPEKLYPQTDYSDDVAPRETDTSDPILYIKRAFDQQDYAKAEKNARQILLDAPHFEDARILLGRSLLAQGKTADAEKEFRQVMDEKLPTARSLAWANEELGQISLKKGQNAEAVKYFEEAIKDDAEYGATIAARSGRNKANSTSANDEAVKNFFAQFDKAAVSGRKADIDALIISGEIPRFSGGIAGAQQWQTNILQIDKIDSNNYLVETNLNIKLLGKDAESGTAVFRLAKVNGNWRLSGVDIFEVR